MTEQTNTNPANNAAPATPAKKTSRRKWLIGGAIGAVALTGLAAAGAVQASGGWGGGWHGHRGGHHFGRTMDPAMMGKKVDFGVDLILGRVGANEEQKTKVSGTIKEILKQVPDFRKERMEAREKLVALLKADKFDKAALETLRAAQIKAIDEASKKLAAAVGEVADTLTDKQRKELAEFAEKRRRMFGRH